MSTLSIIPNMKFKSHSTNNGVNARRVYNSMALCLKMSTQQLQYLLVAVSLLSIGTMLLTYPM